jgi:hypothetical protein
VIKTAKAFGIGVGTVQRIKQEMASLKKETERLMTARLMELAEKPRQQKASDGAGAPEFSDPPTPDEIEREIQWEREAIEAGIRRYREELNDPSRTLADTSPGQRIIREIMKEFVPFLADAQQALKAGMLEPGRSRDWMFLIQLLSPEVLAFLTIRAVMITATTARDGNDLKRPKLLSCIRTLVTSIEEEVAFRSWKAEERANKREARELGKPYQDLYDALRRSVKTVNPRTFRRWMNRIGRLWRQGWPESDKVQLGGALIHYMVECGGGAYFTLPIVWYSGKLNTFVTL